MIQIYRGEDRNFFIDVIQKRKNTPPVFKAFDLTNWTKIKASFEKSNGSKLEVDTDPAHGRLASAEYEGVTFTADTIGTVGNDISLVFDGTKTIAQVINDWNAANPTNTVSSDAEDDTEVLPAETVELEGGLDNYPKVEVTDAGAGRLKIILDNADTNSLRVGPRQNITLTIDFGEHDLGNRRIVEIKGMLDVMSSS